MRRGIIVWSTGDQLSPSENMQSPLLRMASLVLGSVQRSSLAPLEEPLRLFVTDSESDEFAYWLIDIVH